MTASAAVAPNKAALAVRCSHQASIGSAAIASRAGEARPPAPATRTESAIAPRISEAGSSRRTRPVIATMRAISQAAPNVAKMVPSMCRRAEARRQEKRGRDRNGNGTCKQNAEETALAQPLGRIGDRRMHETLTACCDIAEQLSGSGSRQTQLNAPANWAPFCGSLLIEFETRTQPLMNE